MAHKKHKKAARKGAIPLGASPVTLAFAVDVAEYLAGLREAVDAAREFAAANRALIAAMEDEAAQLRAAVSQPPHEHPGIDSATLFRVMQEQTLQQNRKRGAKPGPDDAPETPGD